jgi:hypothetical protein
MIRRLLLGWNGAEGIHSQIVAATREQRYHSIGQREKENLQYAPFILHTIYYILSLFLLHVLLTSCKVVQVQCLRRV